MKKVLAVLLLGLFMACSLPVSLSENASWVCPNCAYSNTGNFCSNCGNKKPDNNDFAPSVEENAEIILDIEFEENLMFSTYDVEMFIDSSLVTTLAHGKGYSGSVILPHGQHTIEFCKKGDSSIFGKVSIDVNGDGAFSCEIHAKNNKIKVDKTRFSQSGSPARTVSADASNTSPTDAPRKVIRYGVGETVTSDNVSVTLNKVSTSKGSSYNKPDAGNVFVILEFTIENNSSKELSLSSLLNFDAYCDDFSCDYSFSAMLECKNQLDGTIAAGKKLKGQIAYEVDSSWKEMEIHFGLNLWSNDKLVFFASNK